MDAKTHKALRAKLATAEVRGSRWLAEGNEAAELGKPRRAQRCYDKAQEWLDRANEIQDQLDADPR